MDILILALLESKVIHKITNNLKCCTTNRTRNADIEYDADVINEEERLKTSLNEVIRVSQFRKLYQKNCLTKPFLAVENISFGLDYGECFALLGVNGAGKSTTFKSLTASVQPTEGEISVAGLDLTRKFD